MQVLTSSSLPLAAEDLSTVLNNLDEDRLAILIAGLTVCLVALVLVVGIVCWAIVAHRRNRMEHELKREMMERGATYEEMAGTKVADRGASKETRPWKSPGS